MHRRSAHGFARPGWKSAGGRPEDAPLIEKIGQYRAQGRLPDDTVVELVS